MGRKYIRTSDRQSKYKNVKTEVDGIIFHSKKEARRYGELKLLLKAGEIAALELQPRYELLAACKFGPQERVKIGEYIADFSYFTLVNGQYGTVVIEDVKGVRTPLYRLKKTLAEACHGITIREI